MFFLRFACRCMDLMWDTTDTGLHIYIQESSWTLCKCVSGELCAVTEAKLVAGWSVNLSKLQRGLFNVLFSATCVKCKDALCAC